METQELINSESARSLPWLLFIWGTKSNSFIFGSVYIDTIKICEY